MSVYIMESTLIQKLREEDRKKYSGDEEYTLLVRIPTGGCLSSEPSYGLLSTKELEDEIDFLGDRMCLNGYRYSRINEQFSEILKKVATDYAWNHRKSPGGISDVDKVIRFYIKKNSN